MNNKLILKLLSLILVVVMLSSVLASCVSNVEPSNTSTTANGETTTTTSSTNGTKPGATTKPNPDGDCATSHTDDENDGFCDHCGIDVVETIDFYNINDLHGKFENTDDNTGVDELTTYLENRKEIEAYVLLQAKEMLESKPQKFPMSL